MFRRSILFVTVLALVGCSESMSQLGGKSSPDQSMGENNFFKVIANANGTEIQSSQMALTQSQNQQVRQFAQHMINDHTMAGQQVQQLASQKGVTLPTKLDSIHQTLIDGLKNRSGSNFDRAYVQAQITAHQDTIDNAQREAENGNDADVKSLAQQLLPKLQGHLRMAQQLQSSM